MLEPEATAFSFPCDFPVKILGRAEADFDTTIIAIVRRHYPDLREGAVSLRPSRQGAYLAITVTVQAHSQAQLDALYQELSHHPLVTMVL